MNEILSNIKNQVFKEKPDLKPHIREKMGKEIEQLIYNIFQLKVYEILLQIDEFKREEILQSSDYTNEEEKKLRAAYQIIKEYMIKSKALKEEPNKYEEFFERFFTTDEYSNFKKYYFEIKQTDLINIIAVDTVKRIRQIGVTLRFGTVFDEVNLGAVQ